MLHQADPEESVDPKTKLEIGLRLGRRKWKKGMGDSGLGFLEARSGGFQRIHLCGLIDTVIQLRAGCAVHVVMRFNSPALPEAQTGSWWVWSLSHWVG